MKNLLDKILKSCGNFKELAKILEITKPQIEDLYYDFNADLNVNGFSAEHFGQWLFERINNN